MTPMCTAQVEKLRADLRDIHTATKAAEADRRRLALEAAQAPEDTAAGIEAKLADIEAELAGYSTQAQRLNLAIEAAAQAAEAETTAALEAQLAAAKARALDPELTAKAQGLDDALAASTAAAQAFAAAGGARREALLTAGVLLGKLVPGTERAMVEAAAMNGPLASGDAIRDAVLTRLFGLFDALGYRMAIGPVYVETPTPLADIVAGGTASLTQTLAGWTPETVRAAQIPTED